MKNILKKHGSLFVLLFLLFTFTLPNFHLASASGYQFLAPIPTNPNTGFTDLSDYMRYLYVTIVGLAIVLGVVMIVIGGIQYVTAAVPSAKEEGKKRIGGAIIGVLLALISYVAIEAINPKLNYVGLFLPQGYNPPGGGGGVPPKNACTQAGYACVATCTGTPHTDIQGCPSGQTCCEGGGGSLGECKSPKAACNTQEFKDAVANNSAGIDANLLYTILVAGEGCNPAAGDHSSCGYGQVLKDNRRNYCGLSGTAADCELFKRDLQADIDCASKHIQKEDKPCFPFNPAAITPNKGTILGTKGSAGYIGACYNCGPGSAGRTGGGPGKSGNCCGTDSYCVRIQKFYNSCVQ